MFQLTGRLPGVEGESHCPVTVLFPFFTFPSNGAVVANVLVEAPEMYKVWRDKKQNVTKIVIDPWARNDKSSKH